MLLEDTLTVLRSQDEFNQSNIAQYAAALRSALSNTFGYVNFVVMTQIPSKTTEVKLIIQTKPVLCNELNGQN